MDSLINIIPLTIPSKILQGNARFSMSIKSHSTVE